MNLQSVYCKSVHNSEMESKQVRNIVLSNDKWFNLSEVADDLWITDKKIAKDVEEGSTVLIVVMRIRETECFPTQAEFPEAERDGGSSLNHFVEKLQKYLEGDVEGPKRQFLVGFHSSPTLLGHRAYHYMRPREKDENFNTPKCSLEDVQSFTKTATDVSSYSTATCW
ncbi:L-allo-isoleucine:holo-[CmaA peptidyl-carrier protein] ligase [Frankliniella fusca]|uniref:L-allo-isoleucine:holo-[CmaA peptidyl-carrier protein] ligase n=1 Tax=Frankliniella fusca TaxID=407009 RepID=A0AAE1HCY2_9NEOP|nr:L-allo-isoleucine:holo-[CmaA peptidyl-carrier protein] ligase [Frankliniella fusca]KAK3918925.1 L-allo-isoleucine:holo-[CmaA peptidyl-carrier protein] ligase [Frankliniella fusca]